MKVPPDTNVHRKSTKNGYESQRKITDLFFSSARSRRKKTLLENIEGFKYYRNGTLKKRCIRENLMESVGGRNSLVI